MSDLFNFTGLLRGLGLMGQPQQVQQPQQAAQPLNPGIAGHGMVRGAADAMRMQKAWQDARSTAVMNGEDFPDFETWMKIQGLARPGVMPR